MGVFLFAVNPFDLAPVEQEDDECDADAN